MTADRYSSTPSARQVALARVQRQHQSKKIKLHSDDNRTTTTTTTKKKMYTMREFSESMLFSLFSPQWHVRHGAALALFHVLSSLPSAQASPPSSVPSCWMPSAAWLEDALVRLVCIVALDQFADYRCGIPIAHTHTLFYLSTVLDCLSCEAAALWLRLCGCRRRRPLPLCCRCCCEQKQQQRQRQWLSARWIVWRC